MIYGNIRNLDEYEFLPKNIMECFTYANVHELSEFEKGSHPIDGDRFFVNIVEYETTEAENRFWEAHRDYLDVHLMLRGTEQIDLNFIENMEQKAFVKEDDFLPLEGEKKASVILSDGDFLICEPHDGHRTAVKAEKTEYIKKAIFKVRLQTV